MRKVLKWIGYVLGGVVGFVLLALVVVYAISEWRMGKEYRIETGKLSIPSDPISIERGRHISHAIAMCVECHGDNLGGKVWIDDPMLGSIVTPNLTMGGIGKDYSPEDWVRAIRHGVGKDGHGLLIMPSKDFYAMSDEEVGAVVAYIKSVPPVMNELPDHTLLPMTRILYVTGAMPLVPAEDMDHAAPRPAPPPIGATAAYGGHLAMTAGCVGCHGPTFSGGVIPGTPPDWPPARNLTLHESGLKSWTEAQFFSALREGKRPDGTGISERMPWKYTAKMTDDEIRAIWLYLQTVAPKPYGNR